jgi:hypothetical protein
LDQPRKNRRLAVRCEGLGAHALII